MEGGGVTRKGYFFADERVTPTGLHGPFASKRDAWEWWDYRGRRLGFVPALITAEYDYPSLTPKSLHADRRQGSYKSSERP